MVTRTSKQLQRVDDSPIAAAPINLPEPARQMLATVGPAGRDFLEDLRSAWGYYEHTVERPLLNDDGLLFTLRDKDGNPIRDDEGNLITATETVTELRPAPITKRHIGVAAIDFYRYAATLKDEEQRQHVRQLIRAQTFELSKALSVSTVVPTILSRQCKPTTWRECQATGAPTLATMKKYRGETLTVDVVVLLITNFAKKFGRRNDLTEDDCRELAEDIIGEFYLFTFAEIKMVLILAMRNNDRNSKVYSLDYSTAYRMFAEMYAERCERVARIAEQEHRAATYDPFARSSEGGEQIATAVARAGWARKATADKVRDLRERFREKK